MAKKEHVYEVHINCAAQHCPICDGGLAWCTVCVAGEGELTTECAGRKLTPDEKDLVMKGSIDFKDGKIVARGPT